MKMKNSFYSIWAKVVVCCFWMMTFSFLIVGLTVHLMNQLNVWNLLPWPSDRTAFYPCAGDHHNDPWGVYQYVYLQACA